MDVDISDILADVSRPTLSSTSQSHGQSRSTSTSTHAHFDAANSTSSFTDHQLLVRAWTSERCAPDLLPYPTALMERVMERVQAQIARIEDLAGAMSDGASVNGRGGNQNQNQNQNLVLSILQTDLSRTQFLTRSFLRQRLHKVARYAVYFLTQLQSNETKKESVLSEAEIQFVQSHQALLTRFYEGSFMAALPAALRRLDDRSGSGGVGMVEGPGGVGGDGAGGKEAVVVRCLSESWSNEEEVENVLRDGEEGGRAEVELRMSRGQVWVVRWGDVRNGVLKGDLEVL